MGRYIKPSIIFLLLLCIAVACDGTNGNNTTTRTIGPEGGTITSSDGRLTLEIPPGALDEDTEITIIRLRVPGDEDVDLLGYEFLPDGLEFFVPARVMVNVEEIVGIFGEDEILFTKLPIIITTEGEEVVTLDNLTLNVDLDTGSVVLSGDKDHFSRDVIGSNVMLLGSIEGVPFQNPANSPLPVNGEIIVSIANDLQNNEGSLSISYMDKSIPPVIYKGSKNPTSLSPPPEFNQTKTYVIPYECGEPGPGKFRAEIKIEVKTTIEIFLVDNEINIAAAFVFGIDEAVDVERPETELRTVFLDSYTLQGMRDVVCLGTEPTPEPSPEPTPEPSPGPTPEPTPVPTPTPEQPVKQEGLYESVSGSCGISSFTLSITEDGNLSLTGFGQNSGSVIFDQTGNPLNFDHPALDLTILGIGGHSCDITCNQAGTQVTLNCSRPGGMCTQTLVHQGN